MTYATNRLASDSFFDNSLYCFKILIDSLNIFVHFQQFIVSWDFRSTIVFHFIVYISD